MLLRSSHGARRALCEGPIQDVSHTLQTLAVRGVNRHDSALIMHEIPNCAGRVPGQRVQSSQCQAAPRRPQNRQPGDPIGSMQHRPRECGEVPDYACGCQRVDLHCAVPEARGSQRRKDCVEVGARPNQDGHFAAVLPGIVH